MRLPGKHRRARVELLPLMDVVFLILIFLVYAMMVMVVQRGMPVALPASTGSQPEHKTVLALTIEEDGKLWLDKKPVSLEDLPQEIVARMRPDEGDGEEEPALQIFADAALPYQKLFSVLDILKSAGLKKISLQSRPPQ